MAGRMVVIRTYYHPAIAEVYRCRLEAEGVYAEVLGDHLSVVEGFPFAFGGVQLAVQADDATNALSILNTLIRVDSEEGNEERLADPAHYPNPE